MELLVSCSKWDERKGPAGASGVYRIDFEKGTVLQQREFSIPPDCSHGCAGLTHDDRFLYVARQQSAAQDEIVCLDLASFDWIDSLHFDNCQYVHQIDLYDGLLWICNTNWHEVLVVDARQQAVRHRKRLLPQVPEDRLLQSANTGLPSSPQRDHRRRPHFNSLQVRRGEVQVGLFGVDYGDFLSPQLLRVPWTRQRDLLDLSTTEPIFYCGLQYPHNIHIRPDGTPIGCASATGDFVVGKSVIHLGGWPRGIAIDADNYYVGISSHSYDFGRVGRVPEEDNHAGIVRIDRRTLEPTGRFSFHRPGQIYDVRIAHGPDYGMSAYAEADLGLDRETAEASPFSVDSTKNNHGWHERLACAIVGSCPENSEELRQCIAYLRFERDAMQLLFEQQHELMKSTRKKLETVEHLLHQRDMQFAAYREALEDLTRKYEETFCRLHPLEELGPVALGIARTVHTAALRYPGLASQLKKVWMRSGRQVST